MEVTLPADLTKQVEQELADGHYRSRDELIEQAVDTSSTSASVASSGSMRSVESGGRLIKKACMSGC
jgi:Arc/MetJ-type ribon-helix-helix transcriptional regulator